MKTLHFFNIKLFSSFILKRHINSERPKLSIQCKCRSEIEQLRARRQSVKACHVGFALEPSSASMLSCPWAMGRSVILAELIPNPPLHELCNTPKCDMFTAILVTPLQSCDIL